MELGNRKRKGRPNYPTEFKHQLAVAACVPGVSVSRLAQEHGINTNMLFKWRRDRRANRLVGPAADGAKLLPVVLNPSVPPLHLASRSGPVSSIEITIADAAIRVSAGADAALLRLVLQSLRA